MFRGSAVRISLKIARARSSFPGFCVWSWLNSEIARLTRAGVHAGASRADSANSASALANSKCSIQPTPRVFAASAAVIGSPGRGQNQYAANAPAPATTKSVSTTSGHRRRAGGGGGADDIGHPGYGFGSVCVSVCVRPAARFVHVRVPASLPGQRTVSLSILSAAPSPTVTTASDWLR